MLFESLTVGLSCLCLCLMTLKCLLNQCIEIEVIRESEIENKSENKTENNKDERKTENEQTEQKENTDNNVVTKPDINQLSEFQITLEPKLIKVLNTITEEGNEDECIKKLSDYIKESLSENELR